MDNIFRIGIISGRRKRATIVKSIEVLLRISDVSTFQLSLCPSHIYWHALYILNA